MSKIFKKYQKSIINIMKVVYLIPLMLISFSLMQMTACNNDENPVVPIISIPILDSNVFDWEIDTLYTNTSRDFFVADTSNIFIAGNPYSVYKSGNSIRYINHQDNDFFAFCVNGTDINNVYIGGGAYYSQRTKLKRWNGISIEDINLPIDSIGRIDRIETISANDIWLSTAKNIIYHYIMLLENMG